MMEIKSVNTIVSLETEKLNKLRNQYAMERASLQNFEKQIQKSEKQQKRNLLNEYKNSMNGLKKEKTFFTRKLNELKANATQLSLERAEKLKLLNNETKALEIELNTEDNRLMILNQKLNQLKKDLVKFEADNKNYLINVNVINETIKVFRKTIENNYQLKRLSLVRCIDIGSGVVCNKTKQYANLKIQES